MATDPDNTWLSATGGWGAAAGASVMAGAGYLSSGFATGVKTAEAQTPEGWKSAATAAMSGGAAAGGYLTSGFEAGFKTAEAHPKATAAIAGGTLAVVGAPMVLSAVGIGSKGVAAGSAAAGWHGSIGNVAAGSTFAACQSAGAAGMATTTLAAVGSAGAAGGAALCTAVQQARAWRRNDKD